MDLGLKGRKAIVCAASKGLGRGCAEALAAEGVDLVICARTRADIESAAAEIAAKFGVKVTPVACDVTTEEGRKAVLAACPDPDILVTNAAGPPAGDFRNFTLDDWRKAAEGNFFTPIALIQATVYGMMERGFGRIVNITSASVKAPIAMLELSNGVRAGLTGAVATLARTVSKHNVTINNLLPGQHDTDRLTAIIGNNMKKSGKDRDATVSEMQARIPANRFGTAEEFGHACAFLCSAKSGFITGQNLVADGGAYPGTL
ncbi:MAG TPA: SDR family oxidoreductase [Beijerinckiaceae bacterium]|nr:SDR family oxidoreductase [Beijerinckiaceae bacterium]